MSKTSHYSLLAALSIITAVVFITIRFRSRPGPAGESAAAARVFAQLRSLTAEGWKSEELPMGDTELGKTMVNRILRYDQAFYAQFSSAGKAFSVYIAYWQPGKIDIRGVNAHTPDTCWVQSGWDTRMHQSGFTGPQGNAELLAGEYRCYENNGTIQYVAFWHLLGGQAIPMWRNGFPKPAFMWKIFKGNVRMLSAEQYFIRISSPQPLEEMWNEPIFQDMLHALTSTGLIAQHAPNPAAP